MTTKTKTTWRTVRLGDVADINAHSINSDFPHKKIEYIDISAVGSGIISGVSEYEFSEAPGRARRLVMNGDTILSTVRPNRRSFLYIQNPKENVVASTGFAVLSPKKETDPRFLYYLVTRQKFTDYLSSNAKGSAYPAVSTEVITDAEIFIPSFDEQKRITEILSALDEKIENNNRIIKTLEEMAQAIFKEWFVDTESVRTQHSHKHLSDIAMINPPTSLSEGTSVYVEMKDLPESGMWITSDVLKRYGNGSKFTNHDILLARITPCLENGKTGYVNFLKEHATAWGSTEFLVLRPRSPEFREYIYLLARSSRFRSYATGHMVGSSGRQRVNAMDIGKYQLTVPDKIQIDKFHNMVEPCFEMTKKISLENQKLSTMRDLLLPRLMSGEIRV